MQKTKWMLILLALSVPSLWAQQELAPSSGDGPLHTKPASPAPGKDGVYRPGPGIVLPVLVHPVAAAFPPGLSDSRIPHLSTISAVIGIDGISRSVKAVGPMESIYDAPAIEAVKQSQFQAGTLSGNPIPVRICAMVPFFYHKPAMPQVVNSGFGCGQSASDDEPARLGPGVTPPRPINTVEAEYSDEARHKKIQGTVLVSVIVDSYGVPANIRVLKPLGYGLDEAAVAAARQYRFEPAMRDGKPVPVMIHIEVNFRLYKK